MANGNGNPNLRMQDLAEPWNMQLSSIRYLIATRQLEFYRFGKKGVRFKLADIEAYEQSRKNAPPEYDRAE